MGRRIVKPVSKARKAARRNESFASLSLSDKIKSLDDRLGMGQGAEKQRRRLARRSFVIENVAKAHVCNEGCSGGGNSHFYGLEGEL
jgi:hypothetical protein